MLSRHIQLSIAACLTGLGLAGCAATDAPAPMESEEAFLARIDTSRSCFTEREIRGYSAAPEGSGNSERIVLDTGLNEEFVLETLGACPDLDWSLRISLSPSTIGRVCTGDVEQITIASRANQGFGQCAVRVLGRLRPENT